MTPGPTDPSPRPLETRAGTLAVASEGPRGAPPLLCVHGLPGSSRDFRYLGPLLAESFRVMRLEMPGFGAAPPGRIRTLQGWGEAILAAVEALGLSRTCLLAHSFGGGAALLAAAAAPERVGHLVLLASMGARLHRAFAHPPAFYRRLRLAVRLPALGSLATARARRSYEARGLPFPATRRDFLLQLGLVGSVDFARLGEAARRYPGPALVIHAADDHLIEPEIPRELARLLPAGRLLEFDEGGHALQKTRAAEIAAAVEELVGTAP